MCYYRFMNTKSQKGKAYIPTELEHKANIYTHGVCLCYHYTLLRCSIVGFTRADLAVQLSLH